MNEFKGIKEIIWTKMRTNEKGLGTRLSQVWTLIEKPVWIQIHSRVKVNISIKLYE